MAKNRAMATKRVTGDSANTIMLRHIRLEHCHVKGCENEVLLTKNVTGVKKSRHCAEHIVKAKKETRKFDPKAALKFGWQ